MTACIGWLADPPCAVHGVTHGCRWPEGHTLDGLTDGGLIRDDARVFKFDVEAWEVTGWTGAEIVLRRWEG